MKAPWKALAVSMLLVLCVAAFPAYAGQPHTVAILPITTGGQENIRYIAEGLRDMIASRIGSGDGLVVIEQAAVQAEYSGGDREAPSPEQVRRTGKALGADYVIFGSTAKSGSTLMIALNLLSVSGEATPLPVFTQTLGLDEVIPRLQLIAEEVRDVVADGLLMPESAMPSVTSPEESSLQRNGEGAEASAGGTASPALFMEHEETDKPGGFEAWSGGNVTDDAGAVEGDGGAAGGEEEAAGGLGELLFKRKGDIQAPPENPVYEKSVDELQGAAETQPEAD